MGQVSATSLWAATAPEPRNTAPQQQDRARTQALVSAVHVINQSGAVGADREVTYSTDAATRALVIQLVDKQSKEVIVQWPSDFALQLAEEFKKEYPNP